MTTLGRIKELQELASVRDSPTMTVFRDDMVAVLGLAERALLGKSEMEGQLAEALATAVGGSLPLSQATIGLLKVTVRLQLILAFRAGARTALGAQRFAERVDAIEHEAMNYGDAVMMMARWDM